MHMLKKKRKKKLAQSLLWLANFDKLPQMMSPEPASVVRFENEKSLVVWSSKRSELIRPL